jgi:hypothetical protein
MKRVKLIATAVTLAVLAVLMANRATAQQANTTERTFMTFSSAVEMPGVTLQPGTYVFKLADSPSRNVVQVWDQDEKRMIGHWTYVQAERPRVSEETMVMFKETREGETPAIQYWYFPGEKIGKEFLYPKDQAQRIAARTGADVRTEDVAVPESAVAAAEPPPAPEAPAAEALAPEALAPEPAAIAENPPPAPVAEPAPPVETPAPVAETRRAAAQVETPRPVGTSGQAASELPRTASPLALSGLLGLLSFAGAAGIRFFRG